MSFFTRFKKGKAIDIRELRGDFPLERDDARQDSEEHTETEPAPLTPEKEDAAPKEAEAGETSPGTSEPGPQGAPGDEDFFELEPCQMGRWSARGVRLPDRVHRDWGPLAMGAGLVAAVGLLVLGLVFLFMPSNPLAPDVRGKPLAQAMERTRSMGFQPFVKQWLYSAGHTDGIVLDQNPRPGTHMKKGQELSLIVSKGQRPDENNEPREIPPASPNSSPTGPSTPLSGKIVCIDPGNQGRAMEDPQEWLDPGLTSRVPQEPPANGVASGNSEQSVTLDVAGKLKGLLEKDGVNVVMTRTSDNVNVSNTMRAEMANNANAELLLSIHAGNTPLDPTKNGCEVLYPEKGQWTSGIYEKSKTAALLIEPELVRSTGLNDLGVSSTDKLTLFNWSKVPVAQATTGYMTNADDDRNLSKDQFRWKVAQGLRNGVIKFLSNR